jgi:aerobic-type carbon monoxide dehydrogenase small subunit (CoxS/CutS family)
MGTRIQLQVNGVVESGQATDGMSLLTFLRDVLDLTGAKEGCNEGECGACVVLLEGRAVNACLVLARDADGQEVTTVEGLGRIGRLHPLQDAFLKHHAVQCGFCSPGMILSALALLTENPEPTEAQVREALAGNLCRCTGYRQILDAVLEAAEVMRNPGQSQEVSS